MLRLSEIPDVKEELVEKALFNPPIVPIHSTPLLSLVIDETELLAMLPEWDGVCVKWTNFPVSLSKQFSPPPIAANQAPVPIGIVA